MDKTASKVINSFEEFGSRMYAYLRFKIAPIIKLEPYIPRKGSILDIGCGYGVTSAYFALKSPKRKVIGTDFDTKRISKAKIAFSSINNVDFYVENLINSKSKKKFDCILLIDVIHHVEFNKQANLLKSCSKHLNKSGIFIIKDIDKKPLLKYMWNYFHDFTLSGRPLCFNNSEDLARNVKRLGFEVEYKRINNLFYPHFALIAKKNT